MYSTCAICGHPRRTEIEQRLAGAPVAGLPLFPRREIDRHIAHSLMGKPQVPPIETIAAGPDRVYANLKRIHTLTTTALVGALRARNHDKLLRALAQDARNAALEARLLPTLREATQLPTYYSITRAEFARLRGVIVDALTPYPEARQAVADAIGASEEARKLERGPDDH